MFQVVASFSTTLSFVGQASENFFSNSGIDRGPWYFVSPGTSEALILLCDQLKPCLHCGASILVNRGDRKKYKLHPADDYLHNNFRYTRFSFSHPYSGIFTQNLYSTHARIQPTTIKGWIRIKGYRTRTCCNRRPPKVPVKKRYTEKIRPQETRKTLSFTNLMRARRRSFFHGDFIKTCIYTRIFQILK